VIAGAALWLAMACPAVDPEPGTPGETMVAPLASAEAQARNGEGKRLYRDGHFAEARAHYAAALAADPGFLAPALNRACALAREERFDEAATEAAALIRRAFIPWGREVLEAADLAALHDRPQMAIIRTALADSQRSWGGALAGSLLFVARTRPPVRLEGEGVLVLGLAQELHAFDPASARYRQVTAEDGRVLAFVRSDDGRTVVYLRGDKLVRQGGNSALRGLTIRRLDLPTMAPGPPLAIDGDVAAVDLAAGPGSLVELHVTPASGPPRAFRFAAALVPAPLTPLRTAVHLTAGGVAATELRHRSGGCQLRARDDRAGEVPAIEVVGPGGHLRLAARFGAGLAGLPFPASKR
jgi:hypothetical protein